MRNLVLALVVLITAIMAGKVFYLDKGETHGKQTLYQTVLASKKIRCGYFIVEPGIFKDPNTGQLSGIAYDLMQEVGKNLGLEIEWTEELGPGELVTALQSGRADMICSSIWLSSARAKFVDNTVPLFFFPATIWVNADNPAPAGKTEDYNTPDMTFAAIDGSTSMFLTKRFFPAAKVSTLPEMSSIGEQFLLITTGKADATILTVYTGMKFAETNPGKIKNALAAPFRNDPAIMLLPKGEEEFKSMINATIDELFYNGYLQSLIQKYSPYKGSVIPRASPYAAQP